MEKKITTNFFNASWLKGLSSFLALLALFVLPLSGQQFYQLNFETSANGVDYTTNVAEFTDGSSDFFLRTDGSDINSNYVVSGTEGSFFFAAQDLDGEGAMPPLELNIAGIDIAGRSNIVFKVLLAEDDSGDGNEDWDDSDFVTFEFQIDGGGFQNLLAIRNDGSQFNAAPQIDTDFDGIGDGTEITNTFAEFMANIAGTGSTLDIKITFDLDSGDEDIAIDDIRLEGMMATGGNDFDLQITEMWPGQEGADVTEDWFEISNIGTEAWMSGIDPDLFYDDESADPMAADPINGITTIPAGGCAIVVIGNANDAADFVEVWGQVIDLTGVQVGWSDGAGLGGGGDAVNLFVGGPTMGDIVDTEAYPDTDGFSGRSWDVNAEAFSTEDVDGALSTLVLGGVSGTEPAIGSPCDGEPIEIFPDPVINEFVFNHTGTDEFEFIELFGDPDATYPNLDLIIIEGDGTVAGVVDDILMPGMADADGYWVSPFESNEFENGTQTLLLVEGLEDGVMGTDLDTDNDGELDAMPWIRIIDEVGVTDGGGNDFNYTDVVLMRGVDGNPFGFGGASRIPNGVDTDSPFDWVRNDFDGEGLPGLNGEVCGEAFNTPGAENMAVPALNVAPGAKLFTDVTSVELSGAEILAYDAASQTVFATSGDGLERINISDPNNPTTLPTIDPTTLGFNNEEITHVMVKNGIVAASLPDANEQMPGDVLFFDTNGNFLGSVEVGALPDMVEFTPDGTKVLTANEGEPNEDYDVDPEGSISIIDISGGVASATVQTADFSAFNVDDLRAAGLKIPMMSGIEALEPEYVASSPDGTKAYATLQEVNAVALIDIASATVTDIFPLGTKDYSLAENAIDASDRDGRINIRTWPVLSLYQPDALATYEVDGQVYFVTANEGDAIDYDGFSEEARVKDLVLDPTAFPDAATLQLDENLGRLKTTTVIGDTDGDGDFDQIFGYGARSFSIWNGTTGAQVFDSGNDFAMITAAQVPELFNSQGDAGSFDNRSDDKGAEPESVTIAEVDGKICAFIGLERIGGYMVYDITDPMNPSFLNYTPGGSDVAPEDIEFVKAEDSPTGEPLVLVSNEESATIAIKNSLIKGACADEVQLCGNVTGGTGQYVSFEWTVVGGTSTGGFTLTGEDTEFLTVDISNANPGTIEFQFTATDTNGCTDTGTVTIEVEGTDEAIFDVTAQFDDFTQVILGSAFVANDTFAFPAGDCHTDLSFAVRFEHGDTCFRGEEVLAATNLTTGAFLQIAGPDAFGDYVFETDDLTAGTYTILVEAQNASAQFELTLVDETGPTLDIPGGTLSLQAPSVCEGTRLQVWSLQADDDCDGETLVEVVSVEEQFFYGGPAPFAYDDDFSGDQYGLLFLLLDDLPFQVDPSLDALFYTIVVRSTDSSGNVTEKTWFVEVVAPAVGAINSLACNDGVNVTLNNNCYAPLFPDAVLEGIPNACEDLFYVKVAYPYDGHSINAVRKCGTFKYTVYAGDAANPDPDNDSFICWGYVTGEDKTPPTGCVDKVVGLRKSPGSATPVVRHGETIDTEIKADYFGAKEGKKVFKKINGTYYFYDPLTYRDLCQGDDINYEINLADPTHNLLICTDVDSILNVGASYSDKNYAYYTGSPYVTDNCIAPGWEPKLLKVTDRLIDYQCDYPYLDDDAVTIDGPNGLRIESQRIIRTFKYEDEKGNTVEIPQVICFFKPRIKLPNCKETFDVCWYGADNELNPLDIGSFPSYTNGACMTMPLLDHVCNVTVTFEDLRLPGPVHCGDKVIRTWTILDWCWDELLYQQLDLTHVDQGCYYPTFDDWSSKKLTYEQHLIIGGSDDIVVECPAKDPEWYGGSDAPTFSVGPFNCEASIEVPAPIIKKDGKASNACQSTWTVEIYAEVDELWHGVPTGNKVIEYYDHAVITEDIDEVNWVTNGVTVSKLPKGAYYFKYVAKDLCGGTAYSEYCKFFIIDEIAPVAICDDDLNISIGGDNYSRVYAKDIDEGSYDSCSDIELTARRFIPEDCFDAFVANTEWSACDIYVATRGRCSSTDPITLNKPASVYDGTKGYYTPWFDYVDFTCCDIKGEVLIELRARDNANMSRDAKGEPIYGDNVKPFPSFSVNQKDNENICWLEVFVEDKLPPICQAPKDKEIDCEDIPYDLPEVSKHTSEGKNGITWGAEELADPANALIVEWLNSFDDAERPAAVDNCDARVEMTKVKFVIHCKAGYIERTFQATDDWGLTSSNSCKQRIWIARHHDYCIKFPKDAEAECKEAPEVPTVEFFEYGCDLLAVSIQDERFNSDIDKGDNSECYKIFRTYRVLNWCQFDEDIDPDLPLFDRFDTEYHLDPLVVGRDEDCDGWPGDEDVYVRFKGKENKSGVLEGTTWIDSDCEPWNDSPKASKHQCDNPWGHWEEIPGYTAGFYQYTQVIKVYDDVAPVVTSVGEERFPTYASPGKGDDKAAVCVGQVDRMFEADDDCTPDHVKIDRVILKPDPALGLGPIILLERGALSNNAAGFGFSIDQDGVKFTLSGQFPIGSHVFEVRVADGCNITAGIDLPFEVFDDKAPAPICNSALSVELMPVDADNDGTRDAGVGMVEVWAKDFIASEIWDCSEPIKYSIERAADIDGGAEPDADNTNLMLNCDDAAAGVVLVYIYAWDAVGNRDRCEAMVIVDDAMEVCGDGAPVGIVSGLIYTEDNRAVPGVEVQVSGQAADAAMTPQNGAYNFGLPAGGDYTVTPFLDLDHKNGVSTADLVQISKHILGVEALNSPYRMIAADVNASASITTLDLIMLRKLILSIDKEFSNNTSWRFVDASYSFPDATNPWREAFPEVINVNDLEADALIEGDFIAVKIGDTNFSANAGDLIQEREIAGTFNINVLDQAVSAGQEYEIEFTADDLVSIEGYQFTLNYTDAVALVDIKEGVAVAENFGLTHTEDNVITTSWNGTSSEEVLFTLVVRANADVALSEVFTIGSLYTQAEAYNTEEELLDVAIDFGSEVVSAASLYELGQNQPNPFKGMTEIKYIVPEAGEATLTITDMTGKVISIVTQDAAKGLNRIELNSNDLPSGVLYYTLESADFTATKKMITVE